jgi:hypothetical protein
MLAWCLLGLLSAEYARRASGQDIVRFYADLDDLSARIDTLRIAGFDLRRIGAMRRVLMPYPA